MKLGGWFWLFAVSSASCSSDAPAPNDVSSPETSVLTVHACCGTQTEGQCTSPEDCGNPFCLNGVMFTPTCGPTGCANLGHACPSGFACNPHGPFCLNQCDDDQDCTSDFYCHDGACSSKLANATPCTSDGECASGHCVESVCCQEVCDPCFSCVALHQSSPKEGDCRPVLAGEDPEDQCEPDGTSCGLTGSCNGQGSCAKAASSAGCGDTSCENGVINGALCDGKGGCLLNAGASCAPTEKCDPTGSECSDACQVDADCPSGFFCVVTTDSGEQHCAKKHAADACAADDECAQGFCRNDRCCPMDCFCDEEGVCPMSCSSNANCPADLRCDFASGRCLAPQLVDAEPLQSCSVADFRPNHPCWSLAWFVFGLVVLRARRPR